MFQRRGAFGFYAFLFLLGLCAQALQAQSLGTIKGQLTDDTGGAIPGAAVTLTGAASKQASTQADGTFTFPGLTPGNYSVGVTISGFEPQQKPVTLGAGKTVTLAFPMKLQATRQEVTVAAEANNQISVEAANNAGSLTLKQEDMDALPDDPDDLAADLQALAGPSAGPSGPQFFIDGFTGGRLPPKESIREIRINQNPFSAEFDRVGFGRIEILTKPGSDLYHGQAFFSDSDAVMNSRNPYALNKPDFYSRQFGGNMTGPLQPGKSSFFFDFERRNIQDNAIVNATLLDSSLNPYSFQQSFIVPNQRTDFSPRIDYQLNQNNTLVLRYNYLHSNQDNAGVGGAQSLNLPSQGYSVRNNEHSVILTETAVLGAKAVNETRVRWLKSVSKEFGDTSIPSVNVLSTFNGGGSQVGRSGTTENNFEVQNFTTFTAGSHALKAGFRVRQWQWNDVSEQNFGGTFTFSGRVAPLLDANNSPIGDPAACLNVGPADPAPSNCTAISPLEQYRRTLLFTGLGYSTQTIRNLGGWPSQFTVNTGNPLTHLSQTDLGLYLQDDWRVSQNLSVNLGLRYEKQTNIHDWRDVAPRIGFAWSPGSANSPKKIVIRGGFGIFYDRFNQGLILNALRLNGTNQLRYTVANPQFYSTSQLPAGIAGGEVSRPTIQLVDSSARAPYVLQTAFGVERQLPRNTTVALNYSNTHGVHQLLDANINAPLAGTYTGTQSSGIRPYGQNNLYQYQSVGMLNQNQLMFNVNSRLTANASFFANYTLGFASSTSDGSGSFPSNPYNIASDYGRSTLDTRHRFVLGGSIVTKWNLRLSPFIIGRSGTPFNIVTGEDYNGDSIFNDRPAFAPNAVCSDTKDYACTAYGNFLLHPGPNDKTIPRNYGTAPAFFLVNLRLSKTWGFGEPTGGGRRADAGGPGGPPGGGFGGGRGHGPGGGHGGDGGASTGRKYNITLSINARNLFNTVNPATPLNTLESPRFGQSNGITGGFGPAGSSANNRRLELMARFSF